MHVDNKKRYIGVLGEALTQGLDDITITAKTKYSINSTESGKRFLLSLYYYRSNGFLFVNATKIHQFNAKSSEVKPYILCLGNISKDFTIDNMNKTGLKGVPKFFLLIIMLLIHHILDIHRYLMKGTR